MYSSYIINERQADAYMGRSRTRTKMNCRIVILLCALFSCLCEAFTKEDRITKLEKELNTAYKQIENLTSVQEELNKHEHVLEQLGKLNDNNKPLAVDGFPKTLTRVNRQADPEEVAFTARLSHRLDNVALGSTLVFDFMVHRTANYYDNTTGVFTCPTPGLYLFAVFIESAVGKEALVRLRMDGNSYMSAISEPNETGEDDTGGNLVLLYVQKGANLWVETYNIDNQSIWPGFTTFSGVLIHRDRS